MSRANPYLASLEIPCLLRPESWFFVQPIKIAATMVMVILASFLNCCMPFLGHQLAVSVFDRLPRILELGLGLLPVSAN